MSVPTPLIYNPAAGQRDRRATVDELVRLFGEAGEPLLPLATERAGHASDLVAELVGGAEPPKDVLCLGGDGTLNEALLGAFRAGCFEKGSSPPRFGILPAGTANVIARDLSLPLNPVAAARVLLEGQQRRFDVGICETASGRRPFLLAFGAGIEAEVVRDVSPTLKRRVGRAAYVWAGIKAAGRADRKLEVDFLTADGREVKGVAAETVLCVNSRLYGGKIRLSPLASSSDGIFELLLLSSTSTAGMIGMGLAALVDRVSSWPGVRFERVREASVRAPAPVALHVDAEPAGETPAKLSLLPSALVLRCGPDQGG